MDWFNGRSYPYRTMEAELRGFDKLMKEGNSMTRNELVDSLYHMMKDVMSPGSAKTLAEQVTKHIEANQLEPSKEALVEAIAASLDVLTDAVPEETPEDPVAEVTATVAKAEAKKKSKKES